MSTEQELSMRLRNKTALITGGNSGIGLAAARLFFAEGAPVAIMGRNQKTLDDASNSLGSAVLALQVDVTDVEATRQAVARVAEVFGKLDIVFANAGIGSRTALGRTSLADFEMILRTNLTAAFFTVQAALPHLNDGASIILTGSNHANLGVPGYSAYAASKAAVCGASRSHGWLSRMKLQEQSCFLQLMTHRASLAPKQLSMVARRICHAAGRFFRRSEGPQRHDCLGEACSPLAPGYAARCIASHRSRPRIARDIDVSGEVRDPYSLRAPCRKLVCAVLLCSFRRMR